MRDQIPKPYQSIPIAQRSPGSYLPHAVLFLIAILLGMLLFIFIFWLINTQPQTSFDDQDYPQSSTNSTLYAQSLQLANIYLSFIQGGSQNEGNSNSSASYITLQPIIDLWLEQLTPDTEIGLVIYDLDHQKITASYHPDQIFNVASIYKLFFTYAGYRQIDRQILDGNQNFITTYDYRAGDYTLYECLDLIIRESYNGCSDYMYLNASYQNYVQDLISELNLSNTLEYGLYSTANDISKLLNLYWEHPDLSSESWNRLSDSMLNQPPTNIGDDIIYDWRQGFPAGFSNDVNVYNKVGWEWNGTTWNVYGDAGFLVFPKQNRHYSFVIISSNLHTQNAAPFTKLGQMLESAITNT